MENVCSIQNIPGIIWVAMEKADDVCFEEKVKEKLI